MDDLKKISVIVPAFNAAAFLRRCVDSILNQTYSNIEIIIVDDGSLDNTANVLENIQAKHETIRAIYKKNEGPGLARNAGIDIASGDYLMFVDADDLLLPACCERVLCEINNSGADFACFGAKFSSDGKKTIVGFSYSRKELFGLEILSNYLSYGEIKSVVWNKIYKKDIIDQFSIRFPIDRINEDYLFTFNIALHSKHVILMPGIYYQHDSCNYLSFSNHITPEHFLSTIKVLNTEYDYLCQNNIYPSLSRPFRIHSARVLTYLIFLAAIKTDNYTNFMKFIVLVKNSVPWTFIWSSGFWNLPPLIIFRLLMSNSRLFIWGIARVMKWSGLSLQ